MLRIRRAIAMSTASLALASGAILGVGAGAAHADGCRSYSTTYKAQVSMCLSRWSSGYITWSWSDSAGTTDERMYFDVETNCGGSWHSIYNANYNDVTERTSDHGGYSCYQYASFRFDSHATETGSWTGSQSISA